MFSCSKKTKYRTKKNYPAAEKVPQGILRKGLVNYRGWGLPALRIMAGRGENRTFCGGFCDNIKKGRRKADFAPNRRKNE